MAYLIDDLISDKETIKIKSLTENEKKVCGEYITFEVIAKPKKKVFLKRLINAFYVLTGKYEAVYFYNKG